MPLYGQEFKTEISPAIKNILKKGQLTSDNLFYSFKNLDSPQEVKSYREDIPFIPASLTKIFSGLYSLKNLGADYQYITSLFYTGKIKNGTLKGDLYLKGTGDPSLTMARLMDLAMDLRAKGIKKITGNFFYDETSQPTIFSLSSFGNGDQTYNPGLSALNLEFNRITLFREGDKRTSKANFVPMPPMIHMQVQKTNETFPLGTRYRYRAGSGGEIWEVSKKQRYRQYEDIPIRNPSRRTAETFRILNKLWGISLPPARAASKPKNATLIGSDKSQPLLRLLALTLEYSNNLFAEQILLTATKKKTIPEAAKVLSKWLSKNIESCNLPLINASGLTSDHKVSASCFVDFLEKYALSPISKRGFMSLLSINGQSGWLKNRLRHPNTNFKVWAKTGSLDYIANMTGVLFTDSGKRYAFALSLSDQTKRNTIDQAIRIQDDPEVNKNPLSSRSNRLKKRAPRWGKKAKVVADNLLKHFIQTL